MQLTRAQEIIRAYGSPTYVYDLAHIETQWKKIRTAFSQADIHYACKANTNSDVIKKLLSLGAGIEAVSPGACQQALNAGCDAQHIIVTCNAASRKELKWYAKQNILVHIDSLMQLERWCDIAPNSTCGIRINGGIGAGHHEHVITGGERSKFGMGLHEVEHAKKIAETHGVKIISLHQHLGSNIFYPDIFEAAMDVALTTLNELPDVTYLDVGGGFGVPYDEDQQSADIEVIAQRIQQRLAAYNKQSGRTIQLKIEPGRYLVAQAGVLLCQVQDIKVTNTRTFVGVDSGMTHLMRPALYGARHSIENLSNPDGEEIIVTLVGNVCETADTFATGLRINACRENDIIAIHQAGAYGYVMASNYNSRARPAEVIIENGEAKLSTTRETLWE